MLRKASTPQTIQCSRPCSALIFTVIIALEFKRSLLVVAERQESIVQVRTVILIALLAIVRKLIILDVASTDDLQLFALAAAILALGAVYWLVRIRTGVSPAKVLRGSDLTPGAGHRRRRVRGVATETTIFFA